MERVAIMVVEGDLPPAAAECCAWVGHPASGVADAARREGEHGTARRGLRLDRQPRLG